MLSHNASRQLKKMPEAQPPTDPESAARLPQLIVHRHALSAAKRGIRIGPVWKTLFAILLLAFGISAGAFVIQGRGIKEPPATSTATTLANVFALGRLEPAGEVISVAAPSGSGEARVEQLFAAEGMQVKAASVLAVLDNEQRLQAAVQVAEDTLGHAHAQLAKTKLEVETAARRAEANLRSAETRLATARMQLQRMSKLRNSNAASADELEQHQLDVATAEQVVEDARAQVARYATTSPGEPLADIVLVQEEIRTAEASLQQARANVEQAYVRAPIDGEVLRLNLRVGERIGAQSLLEMGNTSDMWARVEVYESEIPRLKLGQKVAMTASPLSQPLTGTLDRINTLVRQQSVVNAIPAANTDARVIEVWVRLDLDSSAIAAKFVNLQVRAEFVQ